MADFPPPFNLQDDLDYLWGNFDTAALGAFADAAQPDFLLNFTSLSHYEVPHSAIPAEPDAEPGLEGTSHPNTNNAEVGMLSSYTSRLPSLDPDDHLITGTDPVPNAVLQKPHRESHEKESALQWRFTHDDFSLISQLLRHEQSLLPVGFELPSKHALHRYFEGYFTGFLQHLPFLHTPTMSITNVSLALFLAMAAMGAQYRFERQQALRLYEASKALAGYKLRLQSYRSGTFTSLDQSSQIYSPITSTPDCGAASRDPPDSNLLELIQAMVILLAFATYNHHSLLQDAFEIASCVVHSMRESGMLEKDEDPPSPTWEQWAKLESKRRTILGAFIFTHIHSVLYDFPPLLMSSDVGNVQVPLPENQWRAASATEWQAVRNTHSTGRMTFGNAYAAHFTSQTAPSAGCNVSSFGSLALIHGILQQIYLARQLKLTTLFNSHQIPPPAIDGLEYALAQWKSNWEATKEASINPSSSGGPLGFNSTALFRIACIRLHFNMGPYLKFQSRNPKVIAESIRSAPLPPRSPKLYSAILQSAHSLSIPVWFGVEYVARTQTLTWSIVHTLCNVECAFFLSKWLELMALDPEGLCAEEQRLLGIVTSILSETDFKVPLQAEPDVAKRTRQIAVAIVRLLAQTLKGYHVFELVEVLYLSLETYASSLEEAI